MNVYMLNTLASAPIQDIYFDTFLKAWVLSRYSDILEAFHSPFLYPVGPRGKIKRDLLAVSNRERLATRTETTSALRPATLHIWQIEINSFARELLNNISTDRPVDLVREYAFPACLQLASLATGTAAIEREELVILAEEISAAAAEPFDETLATRAKAAEVKLQQYFCSGPLSLRASGFVALSQTLPRMLSNFWLALIQEPSAWERLHVEPALLPHSIEELLRYAGLTRILFRMASTSVNLNGVSIQEGDRLILRLAVANRDPSYFNSPDHLDINRQFINHLSLGHGRHSCVGAPLIRMALITLTYLLTERFSKATLYQEIVLNGGSGFQFPNSLYACLHP